MQHSFQENQGLVTRIIVAITGASGAAYGYKLLEELKRNKIEIHLVISTWAQKTIEMELGVPLEDVYKLADYKYDAHNLDAAISSGSFLTAGMIIAPCSMKTLAGIAQGFDQNLIIRAASVTLKEQRKLILLPRETPLTAIALENMLKLARIGVVIMPPIPAFYNNPQSLQDVVNHNVGRVLDHFKISHSLSNRWS